MGSRNWAWESGCKLGSGQGQELMMNTTVLFPRRLLRDHTGHAWNMRDLTWCLEDGSVCVDKMGKWPYVGDLLKAFDLAQRTLSVG